MKLLVVDDSRAMRFIIRRSLREIGLKGATVSEASNGREALQVIQGGAPDLVICDFHMGEMNGLELLRTLRQNGCASRFGFVTSDANPKLRSEAEQAGAVFVVTKPFTPATFSKTVGPVLTSLGSGSLFAVDGPASGCVIDGNGSLKPSQIAGLLGSIIRVGVQVAEVPPIPLPPKPTHVVAEYSGDSNAVIGCAISDVGFATHIGAALTLIPPAAAAEALAAREVTDVMWENLHEALNVASRLFCANGTTEVKLGKVYRPGEALPHEFAALFAKPATRLDVRATIDTYGEGDLTLVTFPSSGAVDGAPGNG